MSFFSSSHQHVSWVVTTACAQYLQYCLAICHLEDVHLFFIPFTDFVYKFVQAIKAKRFFFFKDSYLNSACFARRLDDLYWWQRFNIFPVSLLFAIRTKWLAFERVIWQTGIHFAATVDAVNCFIFRKFINHKLVYLPNKRNNQERRALSFCGTIFYNSSNVLPLVGMRSE